MNGGFRIVGLHGRDQQDAATVEDLPGPLDTIADFDEPVESGWGRIGAGAAVVLGVGWLIVAGWLAWPRLAGGDGAAIVETVALATAPLTLIGIAWLLTMRTSRAEARRFGASARAMRTESARLERAVSAMARRLEDSRASLHEQTGAMMALGEQAAQRIAVIGTGIGEQAAAIAAGTARLDTASANATGELSRLIDALPAARDDAAAMARALTGAGTAAGEQVTALDQRLEAVIERGQAARGFADGAVQALADRLTRIADESARADTTVGAVEQAVARVLAGLGDADARLDTLHALGVTRAQALTASIDGLGGSAQAMTAALHDGDAAALGMIGRAEQALTAVDAVTRELDETLPEALARLDARVADSRALVAATRPELLALVSAAQTTHDTTAAIAAAVTAQRDTLDRLSDDLAATLTEARSRSDAFGVVIGETIDRAQGFARDAAPQLVDALLRVRDTANTAAERAREALAAVIPEAAAALEASSTAALKRAAAASVERQVAALTEATEVAVEAGRHASDRLTRQLMTIADTTAAVEARIDAARAARAEADRETIARRSATLIEALNSNAIDLSDALATEASDGAWAAYLKGDRGVFTRRAVRLLDNGAAREIAALYNQDARFREQTNRYIHDFEAMLRDVLADREGSPIGVALLSSDLGKLYVALAQAIERLRA